MQRTGAGRLPQGFLASTGRLLRRAFAAGRRPNEEGRGVLFLALFLLLIAIVIGLGFIVRALFYLAVVLGLIWVIVFFWRNIRGRT